MSVGVFQDLREVVNRAPVDLTVTFDGQSHTMKPGKNMIPAVTIPYAKNQNPQKGTGDLDNPTATGVAFLLGVVGTPDNCDPLTDEEWAAHCISPSRFNTDDILEQASRRLPPGYKLEVKKAKKQSRFSVASTPQTEFGGND